MENVAPLLEMIWAVRFELEDGVAVRSAIVRASSQVKDGSELLRFVSCQSQGQPTIDFLRSLKSPARRLFYIYLSRGLAGEAILSNLKILEQDVSELSRAEIDAHLSVLPYKMMLPLLFLQLPAFLMILFGPILNKFFHSLQGL